MMSDASLSRFLPLDCNRSASLVVNCLGELGLSVIRSFDLQATRSLQENQCTCPHHGTSQCTCQWMILLVYGKRPEPLTLVLDGQEDHTWLTAVNGPGQRADLNLAQKIFETIEAEVANQVDVDQDCEVG
jgi:hypothetical protein